MRILRILAVTLMLAACGDGGGSDGTSQDNTQWVRVDAVTTANSVAELSGTAWVSQGWVALHCGGLACLFDTSTDNYPGVTVTCANLTSGATQTATSFYGGGTHWAHNWQASVPVVSGRNVLRISAFDPAGKGGSITLDVIN